MPRHENQGLIEKTLPPQPLIEMAGIFLSDGELPSRREVNRACYALLCSVMLIEDPGIGK